MTFDIVINSRENPFRGTTNCFIYIVYSLNILQSGFGVTQGHRDRYSIGSMPLTDEYVYEPSRVGGTDDSDYYVGLFCMLQKSTDYSVCIRWIAITYSSMT